MSLDIDERAGWPEELLDLLRRYPRETWRARGSAIAQFWLERHDAFRRQCDALESLAAEYRAERLDARRFAASTAPALQNLLAHLHGHHQIEDFHYFPYFRAAEPSLARGFETLERDHQTLHAGMAAVVEAVNALLGAVAASEHDRHHVRGAAERYSDASLLLIRRLARHLDDEEDLIIPLMLDRG
ncbi:MAG TPA: hemerythrin domain-containing protein [Gammaproteobacteria bacterium]